MNNVQFEVIMNKVVTSKEEILQTSRELIQKKGWSAVSIRSVASACNVSVGSIYNYFDSKTDLVGATIESVWNEIFHTTEDDSVFQDIQRCVQWIYQRMAYGNEKYPGFFTLHSISYMKEDKSDGIHRMHHAWQHILDGICGVLKNDPKVRKDAFTDEFTAEKFSGILFSLILSALLKQDFDSSAVCEVVRRTVY